MSYFFDLQEVRHFLLGPSTNSWVRVGPFNIYMRKAVHAHAGMPVNTIDLANIVNTVNPGKGAFRALIPELRRLLEVAPALRGLAQCIYLESVVNTRFAGSLPSMGFFKQIDTLDVIGVGESTPSFFLPLRVKEILPQKQVSAETIAQDVLRKALNLKIQRLAQSQSRLAAPKGGASYFEDVAEQAVILDEINRLLLQLRQEV